MKGKVLAVFPGLGKSTVCNMCYDNSTVLRTKFLDLDYHYFKKFVGPKSTSSQRSMHLYRAAVVSFKRLEPRTVILVNHLSGLEGLIDGILVPGFCSDELKTRFLNRHEDESLEPGEKEILRDYDVIIDSWRSWADRNHVKTELLSADKYLYDSAMIWRFVSEFEHYEDNKRR